MPNELMVTDRRKRSLSNRAGRIVIAKQARLRNLLAALRQPRDEPKRHLTLFDHDRKSSVVTPKGEGFQHSISYQFLQNELSILNASEERSIDRQNYQPPSIFKPIEQQQNARFSFPDAGLSEGATQGASANAKGRHLLIDPISTAGNESHARGTPVLRVRNHTAIICKKTTALPERQSEKRDEARQGTLYGLVYLLEKEGLRVVCVISNQAKTLSRLPLIKAMGRGGPSP